MHSKKRNNESPSETLEKFGERSITQPPLGSALTIERLNESVVIHAPPTGYRKGSKGLMYSCLIWNVLVAVFVVIAVLAALGKVKTDLPVPCAFLALAQFIVIGVGLLLAVINMGHRNASLAVAHGSLFVVRQSIFRKRQWEWLGGEIKKICVGPSGMQINDIPVNELEIHPYDGNKVGMLGQLSDDELEWIAAELNQALDLPTTSLARD